MSIRIRKIHATPEENRFADLIDACYFIAAHHGTERGEFSKDQYKKFVFADKRVSIAYHLSRFRREPMGLVRDFALVVMFDKRKVLVARGKWQHVPFETKYTTYVRGVWERYIQAHAYVCDDCYEDIPNPQPTQFQKKIERLAGCCIGFAQRKGHESLDTLIMPTYEFKNASISMSCQALFSPTSNGFSKVIVRDKNGRKVFHAEGKFIAAPYRMKTRTYIPGAWESIVQKKRMVQKRKRVAA